MASLHYFSFRYPIKAQYLCTEQNTMEVFRKNSVAKLRHVPKPTILRLSFESGRDGLITFSFSCLELHVSAAFAANPFSCLNDRCRKSSYEPFFTPSTGL